MLYSIFLKLVCSIAIIFSVCFSSSAEIKEHTLFGFSKLRKFHMLDRKVVAYGSLSIKDSKTAGINVHGNLTAKRITTRKIDVFGEASITEAKTVSIKIFGNFFCKALTSDTLQVNGKLHAEKSNIHKISVEGEAEIEESNIKFLNVNAESLTPLKIKDNLKNWKTFYRESSIIISKSNIKLITIKANECHITNSNIEDIRIISDQKRKSILYLSGNTIIKGQIRFENGGGVVVADKEASEKISSNDIIGGKLVTKN